LLGVRTSSFGLAMADLRVGRTVPQPVPCGPHKFEITLVNANHQFLDRSVVVEFVIPAVTSGRFR
jgi:hypothetical protein